MQTLVRKSTIALSPSLRSDEGKSLDLWRGIVRTDESDPTQALDGLLDDLAVLECLRMLMVAIREEQLTELRVA